MTELDGQANEADTVIVGGTLIDGSGADRRLRDIAIRGDRIISIGPSGSISIDGIRQIDATGLIVAPGFIDVHTHDDCAVLKNPEMTAKISQGVTSVVVGNCGISIAPFKNNIGLKPPMNLLGGSEDFCFSKMSEYVKAVDAAKPAVNVAALVGHSTLRVAAMADVGRKANKSEIDTMKLQLAESLEAGAIGFSTGLYYKVAASADMEEVVALAEVLSDFGGIYATHMRDEHDNVLNSLQESIETANRAQIPVVISHHKCAGVRNWGRSKDTLKLIAKARETQNISLDVYPYVAGSTVLEPEMVDTDIRITVTWSTPYPEQAKRDLEDIASDWGCSQVEAARRLSPAGGIYYQMHEADMRRILSYSATMVGSDGLPGDVNPHPRLWGTFPRVLGHYCREEGLFSLEEAVHKMTGLSARNFNLKDRGVIRVGGIADIVLFDADTIMDKATFEDPEKLSDGIVHVFVNGELEWSLGQHTNKRAGRFINREASTPTTLLPRQR